MLLEKEEKYLTDFVNLLTSNQKKQLEEFYKMFQMHNLNLSEKTKNSLTLLSKYGWYMPSRNHQVTFPSELSQLLSEGDEEKVNYNMKKLIKKEYSFLCKNIIEKSIKRKKILSDSFLAHKLGFYTLSIPVFLCQADGICKEITGVGLYFKENKLPKTKKYIDKLDVNINNLAYLEPLRVLMPIIFEEEYLDKTMTFNRHKILHGNDIGYNTENNSYKSFSLLSYICTFLS